MKAINLVVLLGILVTACTGTNYMRECTDAGGTWIAEASECEGISEAQCNRMGGSFDNCASACRNDPNADVCTMQCVQVCTVK